MLPIALANSYGARISDTFGTPILPNSELPALLGLAAARESRMVIDTIESEVYMFGPGNCDLMAGVPPGTTKLKATIAPSGHPHAALRRVP